MRRLDSGLHREEKGAYRIRLEKAMIVSLATAILIFSISRRMARRPLKPWRATGFGITSVDLIPATRQGGVPKPPNRPVVPIPSEDEFLPEDETIETTELDLSEGIPLFEGDGFGSVGGGMGGGFALPIKQVIPDYPESERKRGAEGVVEVSLFVNTSGRVDSVRVMENTTGSRRLRDCAVQAARELRYRPPRRNGERFACWTKYRFTFEKR